MIRRFVNLVTQNPRSNNGAYSLRRLDVAKHLFYPSTAEAEAAANANGSPPPKPQPGIDRLRRLPSPVVRFQQVPPTPNWRPLDDMFVLLSPAAAAGTGGDRILHLHAAGKDGGHGDVYDADSGSVIATVPSPVLDGPNRLGVQPITFSVAGAGADGRQSLYVMTDAGGQSFQRLDLSQHPLEWQPLPPPPFAGAGEDDAASSITSFALVDGGSTICVSTAANGTYCFDTRARAWRRAGDWALPFDGRAHHVPELGAWLGFSSVGGGGERVVGEKFGHVGRYQDHQLCASSDLAAAVRGGAPEPTLEYVWEDLALPRDYEKKKLSRRRFGEFDIERWDEWRPYGYFPHGGHRLIDLGGGRFCVAKVFRLNHLRYYESDCPYCWCTCESEDEPFDLADVVVLAGVEVLRDGGDGGGRLRMVRHKSTRYDFTSDADEIKWCL